MKEAERIMTLRVHPRGVALPALPDQVEVHLTDTVTTLYNRLAASASTSVHRLRVTRGSDGQWLPSSETTSILATGLKEQSVIYVKDLGPQISWRLVFVIEYLGPLFIHPLVYGWQFALGHGPTHESEMSEAIIPSVAQKLVLGMIMVHFIKREYETLLVHRFSASTMPIRNIFKNCAHYWLLSGLNLAYWSYIPTSPTANQASTLLLAVSSLLFVLGETGNFVTHLSLRNLRKEGSTIRAIPRGLGFDLITSPNYTFEAIAWIGILLASRSLSCLLFVLIAVGQMAAWAMKKESRYRKEFGEKYKKKRYSLFPGVI